MTYSPELPAEEAQESPSVICPRLLLGCENDALNSEVLRRFEVTHILNVSDEVRDVVLPSIVFMRISIEDRPYKLLQPSFEKASRFIGEGLSATAGVVLVHCHAGVSRSSAVVIAHLMLTERLSLKEAFARVKRARRIIEPNSGFLNQLRHLEFSIHGVALTEEPLTPTDFGKRFHPTWSVDFNTAVAELLNKAKACSAGAPRDFRGTVEFSTAASSLYRSLAHMDVRAQGTVVRQALQQHFATRSSTHADDCQGREVFASLLAAVAAQEGGGTREGIQLAMDQFGDEEALAEFVVDFPRGRRCFEDLKRILSLDCVGE
eukprot:EG_transcript_2669